MSVKDLIGAWPPTRHHKEGVLNLSTPGSQREAREKGQRAAAKREGESVNRLVRIEGRGEIVADAARRLRVRPKLLVDRIRSHRNPTWADLEAWAATIHVKEPPAPCEPSTSPSPTDSQPPTNCSG